MTFAWWRGFLVPRGQSGRGVVLLGVLLTAALLAASAAVRLPSVPISSWSRSTAARGARRIDDRGDDRRDLSSRSPSWASAQVLASDRYEVGIEEFQFLVIDALPRVFSETLVGLGTGTDTQAAFRYGSIGFGQEIGVGGHWFESYWAKAALEFGIMG